MIKDILKENKTISTFQLIEMVMVKILDYKLISNGEPTVLEFRNTNTDLCHHHIFIDASDDLDCVSNASIKIALLKNELDQWRKKEQISAMISTVFGNFIRKRK